MYEKGTALSIACSWKVKKLVTDCSSTEKGSEVYHVLQNSK